MIILPYCKFFFVTIVLAIIGSSIPLYHSVTKRYLHHRLTIYTPGATKALLDNKHTSHLRLVFIIGYG